MAKAKQQESKQQQKPKMIRPEPSWGLGNAKVPEHIFKAFAEVIRACGPLDESEKLRVLSEACALLLNRELCRGAHG